MKEATDYAFRGYVLLIVSLILILIIMVPFLGNLSLRRRGEPVVGRVGGIVTNHEFNITSVTMSVRYVVDGEEFIRRIRERPFGARTGAEILLFYDPLNPRNVTTGRFSLHHIPLLSAGIYGIVMGVRFLVKAKRLERKIGWDKLT